MPFESVVAGTRQSFHAFGSNPDVNTATVPEDVWSGPTDAYPFPAAAAVTDIVSSDANDTLAGTGARQCRVFGLDANLQRLEELVSLNGVTPVVLANQYFRINRVRVFSAGSGQANAGRVQVRHPGAVVLADMRIGAGRALAAILTIPVDAVAPRLASYYASVGRPGGVAIDIELLLQVRKLLGGGAFQTREVFALNTGATSTLPAVPRIETELEAGMDMRLRVSASSGNSVTVSGGFFVTVDSRGQAE